MQQLKNIRKALKKNNKWKEYNNKFKHKQMKFIVSKIALIFNKEISTETLIELELNILKNKKNEKIFDSLIFVFAKNINDKVDWKFLSRYLWIQYQTSTYYKDVKKSVKNIFNKKNFVKINSQKRDHFQAFINSLEKEYKDFNKYVIAILRVAS